MRIADMIGRRGRYVELLSPRGTDDFTKASANALLCWGFGSLVYGRGPHAVAPS